MVYDKKKTINHIGYAIISINVLKTNWLKKNKND